LYPAQHLGGEQVVGIFGEQLLELVDGGLGVAETVAS